MLGRKVESTRPVTLVEVKKILEQRSVEPDFGYEQQTSLDYARKLAKLTPEDATKMEKELVEEVPALRAESLVKIVDILPVHESTIGAILAKERISLSPAQNAKVLEIVAKFRTKMIAPPEPEKKEEAAKAEDASAPVEEKAAVPKKEKAEEKAEKKEAADKKDASEKKEPAEKTEKKTKSKKSAEPKSE
ncbi:Uncharacterised protein [uncultured archaeon]|nr:Uncharacterised protein [uncultured archaeon]